MKHSTNHNKTSLLNPMTMYLTWRNSRRILLRALVPFFQHVWYVLWRSHIPPAISTACLVLLTGNSKEVHWLVAEAIVWSWSLCTSMHLTLHFHDYLSYAVYGSGKCLHRGVRNMGVFAVAISICKIRYFVTDMSPIIGWAIIMGFRNK